MTEMVRWYTTKLVSDEYISNLSKGAMGVLFYRLNRENKCSKLEDEI